MSIIPSAITGAAADPDFQNVECPFSEFVEAVRVFVGSLREELERTTPQLLDRRWPADGALTGTLGTIL